jgi:hypothetical protein
MVSSKLTVEELIELAKQFEEEGPPVDDIDMFILDNQITQGSTVFNKKHLYTYYKFWSKKPFEYTYFCARLFAFVKNGNFHINSCIDKNIVEREVLLERKKEIEKKRSR